MTTKEPPKPALILATPINVEESRAKRHQRQQSRFRDRGGIFVPSSRSTLADILLGKASPIKKPSRRSISASPTKHKGRTPNGATQDLVLTARHSTSSRKSSPRKQGRKSFTGSSDNANVRESAVTPKGVIDATRTSKELQAAHSSKPRSASKPPSKPPSVPAREKSKVTKATRKSTKTQTQKSGNSDAAPKSKGKGKAHTAATAEATGPKSKTVAESRPVADSSGSTVAASSATFSMPSRSSSRRRKSTIYSDGFSEDEYIPKEVKKSQNKKQSAASEKKTTSTSAKSASTFSKAPPKPTIWNKDRAGAPQLPDIPEEDEEEVSEKEDSNKRRPVFGKSDAPSSKKGSGKAGKRVVKDAEADQEQAKKTKTTASKGEHVEIDKKQTLPSNKDSGKSSKRGAQEAELDLEPPQRSKKRIKPSEKEQKNYDKPKAQRQKRAPRKRPRNGDIDPDPDEEPKKKRNKVSKESESGTGPKSKPSAKAAGPKSQKSTAGQRKEKQPSKLKDGSAPIPQQAATANPPAVPIRRGPPKRVLQRLKECQHHDIDNEPDPIDFLS